MKQPQFPYFRQKAFTLLEMSIVLMVLLMLVGVGLFSSTKMNEWKLGRTASETLRAVYSAQRMYLADHPTTDLTLLTSELILPYLPNNVTVMPTVKSLTGTTLVINVTVSPPHLTEGGVRYDPGTPANYTDSLWDVGE
jgi:prepilin-type N-terminal cleavage/methylation domain-containing protein